MGYGQFVTRTFRYRHFVTDTSLQDTSLQDTLLQDTSLHGHFVTRHFVIFDNFTTNPCVFVAPSENSYISMVII